MKKMFTVGIIVVLLACLVLIPSVSADWLSGWDYRKTINITGQLGAGTYYQVNLSIGDSSGGDFHLEGHCTEFPNDTVITDDDGTTKLPFWIENASVDPIQMWVNVSDNLNASQDIYIYYGRSGETSASNITNTFLFGDYFEDGTMDKWTANSDHGTASVDSGVKHSGSYSLSLACTSDYLEITSDTFMATEKVVVSFWVYPDEVDVNFWWLVHGDSGDMILTAPFRDSTEKISYYDSGWVDTDVGFSVGNWYHIEIQADASTDLYNFYVNDVLKKTGASFHIAGTTFSYLWSRLWGNDDIHIDDVFVRKYNDTEPAFSSAGNEESVGQDYTPPTPTNLQNTTGNFWVNYTWDAGSGNVTNGYNVSNGTVWTNNTNTFYNESVSASEWVNITVYAFNSSGNGTLSPGSVSDQVQAPSYPPCTTPVISSLTNTTSGTQNIIITWTANQSADNRVKYSKNSDLSNEEWSLWDNDTTSISIGITGLDSATKYYYQAWSYNGSNATCYVTSPTSQPYKNFTTSFVSWWNSSWGKRMGIHINNTGGSALTDYQIPLNITYDSDMNNDFSDIRIVNATSNTLVPLWNESVVDGSWNEIWFNVSSVPSSTWINETYYLYYGNPSASSVSNGTNTFLFFDDFSSRTTYEKINSTANSVLGFVHGTFYDGTDYWNAAYPTHARPFVADTWYAFTGYSDYFNASQINNTYQKFIDARDGNGNFPIALNPDGTGYAYYSGCEDIHNHTGGDPIWFLPMMMKLYYDKSGGDTTNFSTHLALIKTEIVKVPRNTTTKLVDAGTTTTAWVTWGFHDGVKMTENDLMGSLLYYKASKDLSSLYTAIGDTTNATFFTNESNDIQDNISTLWNVSGGMFNADTGQNNQISILGSSYAVYINITNSSQTTAISNYLVNNYSTLVSNGYIRQSPQDWAYTWGDMCTHGEGNYDDGYWSIGHEWIATAIQKTNESQAVQFITDFSNSTNLDMEWFGSTANGTTNNLASPMGALKFASDNENLFPRGSSHQYTTNGGSITFSNGKLVITGVSAGNAVVAPTSQSPPSSYIVEARAAYTDIGGHTDDLTGILAFQNSIASSNTGYVAQYGEISSINKVGIENFTVAHLTTTTINFTEGNYYLIKGTFVSGGVKATFERTTDATTTDTTYTSGYYGLRTFDASSNIDWFFVRKYTDPEPTAQLGAEESPTTDTTFTVSLPVGYTKPVFEPPNSTATNYPPNGQTDSQEFFNVTNSGNVNLDVRMRLNTTVNTITLKADSDNNPSGAKEVNTTMVTIYSGLGQGSSANVWLWSDFDHTTPQTANRTVYINVSQT